MALHSVHLRLQYPIYTEQNYLDRDLDGYLGRHMDPNPEDAPTFMGHSLFKITDSVTIVFIVQSLSDGPEIEIIWIEISRS